MLHHFHPRVFFSLSNRYRKKTAYDKCGIRFNFNLDKIIFFVRHTLNMLLLKCLGIWINFSGQSHTKDNFDRITPSFVFVPIWILVIFCCVWQNKPASLREIVAFFSRMNHERIDFFEMTIFMFFSLPLEKGRVFNEQQQKLNTFFPSNVTVEQCIPLRYGKRMSKRPKRKWLVPLIKWSRIFSYHVKQENLLWIEERSGSSHSTAAHFSSQFTVKPDSFFWPQRRRRKIWGRRRSTLC